MTFNFASNVRKGRYCSRDSSDWLARLVAGCRNIAELNLEDDVTRSQLLSGLYLVLSICLTLTVTLFYLVENGRINSFAIYLATITLIPVLFLDWRATGRLNLSLVSVASALLLYLAATSFWGGGENGFLKHIGYALLILAFMIGLALCQIRYAGFIELLAAFTIAAATISALFSLYLHFTLPEYQPLPEPRLYGLGRLGNPVISAVAYGLAIIFAVALTITRNTLAERVILTASILLLLFTITITGTRTVWLALALAITAGLMLRSQHSLPAKSVMSLIAMLLLGATAMVFVGWEDLSKRALSFRPEIWAEFINRTLNAGLLIGVGSGSDSSWALEGVPFKHAHSLFISAFYYGGLIGLLLLITLFAASCRLLAANRQNRHFTMAVMTLVFGMTFGIFDGDNVLTKVDHIWWMVWLPVGLTLSVATSSVDPIE